MPIGPMGQKREALGQQETLHPQRAEHMMLAKSLLDKANHLRPLPWRDGRSLPCAAHSDLDAHEDRDLDGGMPIGPMGAVDRILLHPLPLPTSLAFSASSASASCT
mmetsp:Transcript_70783/g.103720  ORF Transcript_70783/g.103720 Transcript_70783/m.103720 type:complete len:106 (+) Transcript_70783:3-320(+)